MMADAPPAAAPAEAGTGTGSGRGRYSKQRRQRKKKKKSSAAPARARRPAAAPAAPAQRAVVRHSSGVTISTNARMLRSTVAPTIAAPELAVPHDRTVSVATLAVALRQQQIASLYPQLTEECVAVLARWKARFSLGVWTRMTKHGTDRTPRCVKEMNECAPVVVAVRDAVQQRRAAGDADATPVTIIDLCSGFGFLGMLLSELLEPEAVERIHLVDQMWPMANATESGPTQITWEHIRAPGWPIPLRTRKTNLKKGAEMRQLEKYVVGSASGPVIVAGIHLCGALAIKAIGLFNRHCEKVTMICLKPCCLPGRIHAAREETWTVRAPSPYALTALRALPVLSLCSAPRCLWRWLQSLTERCARRSSHSSGRQLSTLSTCTAMTHTQDRPVARRTASTKTQASRTQPRTRATVWRSRGQTWRLVLRVRLRLRLRLPRGS